MHASWDELIKESREKYFIDLMDFISSERKKFNIYPPGGSLYTAFNYPLDKVKVVILGQDPYHGEGQAHGLAFSVQRGNKIPPSLQNIYKELTTDIEGFKAPNHGELLYWAEQGVLLLNTILTVREASPGSHKDKGWERFTSKAIDIVSSRGNVVFILWGKYAHNYEKIINKDNNFIIKSAHPSPMSAYNGFFGSRPFSKANAKLKEWGKDIVDWGLPYRDS
jgi:uracil-DNA glycosylase